MKYVKLIPTCFALIMPLVSQAANASSGLKGCAAKEQQILQQIDYATKHNNHHRIPGLKKALNELRQNCTDARLIQQRKYKIAEKEKKVNERKSQLNRAKETGNPNKIRKKEKKLQEAKQALFDAKSELSK